MLTFLALADAKKPRWIVWENVPGVLSSNGGRDFATFLGALGELGYGFAYRVLDAQHFGVAQRRRRVFVIGYLGDWRPAAAVLFERESLSRDSKPSRKKGQETPTDAQGGVEATGIPNISNALCARDYKGVGSQYVDEGKVIPSPVTMAIRRLTAKECERLQGFPDDFTKIPYRNKPADQCPDGPRYKACGNSMAVPVMRWIGQRIQLIDTIIN